LWKEQSVKASELVVCSSKLKELWTNLIHYCEIPFSYDTKALQITVGELRDMFVKIFTGKITDKNIQMLRYTLDYLVEEKLLLLIFENEDHEEMKKEFGRILKETWILVFGGGSNVQSNTTTITTTTTTTTTTSTTTTTNSPEKNKS